MSDLQITITNVQDAGAPLNEREILFEERWPTRSLEPIIVQNYRPSSNRATRGYEFDEVALDLHATAVRDELPGTAAEKRWLIDGLPSYGNDNLQIRSVASVEPDMMSFFTVTTDPAHRHPDLNLIVYIEPTWDNRYLNHYERMMDLTLPGAMGLVMFTTMISHIEAPYIQFSALDLFTGLLAREAQAFRVLQQLVTRENVLPRPATRYTNNHYYVRHVIVKSLQLDPLDPSTLNRNGVTAIEMIVAVRWSDPDRVHIVSARPHAIDDNHLIDFSGYTVVDPQDTTWNSVRRYFQRIDRGWAANWATDIGVDLGQRDIWVPQSWQAKTAWSTYCDHIRRTAGIENIPDAWWDMSLSRVRVRNIRYLSLDLRLYNEIPQRQIWTRHGKLNGYPVGGPSSTSLSGSNTSTDDIPYHPLDGSEVPMDG